MTTLALRGLTKTYGDVPAVNQLTAELATGRVTGFLGPTAIGTHV